MSNSLLQRCHQTCKNHDEEGSTKLRGQRATVKAPYERQQRYREKQRQYVDCLEATVKRLRTDVDQELIARRNAQRVRFHDHMSMPARPNMMTTSNVLAIMQTCMKVFESGVQDQQARFLKSAMCSDVRFGNHIGRDSILKQWTHFMLYFNDAALVLEHCESNVVVLKQDVTVGRVNALLVIRLTHRSLTTIFPHTLTNMRLRDKLLQNPTIQLPMTVLFQFDEQGKVCRFDSTIDFVAGLHAAVRDYRDVLSILESASIDASGHIRGDLPPGATTQVDISFLSDRRSPHRPSCRRPTAHLNKLSVDFLLSSSEVSRYTDGGGGSAS